jgi:hypothetical protein
MKIWGQAVSAGSPEDISVSIMQALVGRERPGGTTWPSWSGAGNPGLGTADHAGGRAFDRLVTPLRTPR